MKKLLALVIAAALCAGLCGCASTVSVSGAQIDADGHLILSMSDGSTLDAGLARGEKGEKGDKGDKGEQGIQGLPGEKGEKGDKGDRGPRGEKGERGAQGIQGERGAAGYSGGSGASGRDGVDGKTPYIGENGNWWIDGKDTGVYAGNKVEPEPEPDEDTCIVTLNYWYGGSLSEQCNVKKGQTLKTQMEKLPRIDCPSGCYFIGWYIGETPFDINSTIINEDVTVEAKYTSTSYTDEHGFIFLDKDCKKLVGYNGTEAAITTPSTTEEIAARTFANNQYIKAMTVSENVKNTGDYAFIGCKNLRSVTLPNNLSNIGDGAFSNCYSLSSINIPSSLTSISRDVFFNCNNLKEITIPSNVSEIGKYAFSCSGLTSIVIPDSVTTLGDGVFSVTPLTSVTIGKGITALPGSVFANCSKLETVTIGSSIASIGDQAFYNCEKLRTVICEAETPPTLGGYILSVNPNLQIKVPANAVEAYKAAPIWSTYAPYIMANS